MARSAARSILAQQDYARRARCQAGDIVMPAAFVRGIRHLGYRTNVEAIAELVDNAVQAAAATVDIVFDLDDAGSGRTPTALAVIDDGHGMPPEMMRYAAMWGGTHREDARDGLGRFGYGLPCAAASIGRRFTIYSKLGRGRLHAVTLDLDGVRESTGDADAHPILPVAQPAALPDFLKTAIGQAHPDGWRSGTVIVIDKLDRLDWRTATGLRRNLMRHFGVAYRTLLPATRIRVGGAGVRPIDPLFLDPDAAFHDLDEDRAVALDPVTIRIPGAADRVGEITLRYAWLPPSFAAVDKTRDAVGINANRRFSILRQYHGIVFRRNGRLVDVQPRTPWTTFVNNDRYIRIEIDFSAALDEAFGVTTSKQQVSVSPDLWDRLRGAGLHKAIEHLRAKVRTAKSMRPRPDVATLRIPDAPRSDRHATMMPRGIASADALGLLLDEIAERAAGAGRTLQAEYRALLDGWSARMTGDAVARSTRCRPRTR